MSTPKHRCPICDADSFFHDNLEFNKSCEENIGKFLEPSGVLIAYYLCDHCGFCYAPECAEWPLEAFEEKIYNAQYVEIDPEYKEARPRRMCAEVLEWFEPEEMKKLHHLDYGGGDGYLSQLLRQVGWNSSSYDPFVQKDVAIADLGRFDFMTAFEVFEHVPDVQKLMSELSTLLVENGIIFLTTFLSDGHIKKGERLTWWYAAPRNGHISLFSQRSLAFLAAKQRFICLNVSDSFHVFLREVPSWASKNFSIGT